MDSKESDILEVSRERALQYDKPLGIAEEVASSPCLEDNKSEPNQVTEAVTLS